MTVTKCKSCGADVRSNVKFCASCGARVEHDMSTAVPATDRAAAIKEKVLGFNFKKLIMPGIAAVVVLIAIIAAVNIFTPAKYELVKGTVYMAQGDDCVVVIPNGKTKIQMDGRLVQGAYNLDNTKGAVLISEDGDYSWNSDEGSLYLITDKPQFVSEGVRSFWLAASGDAVVYAKDANADEGTAELWLCSGGNKTKLSNDFSLYNDSCAVSPDGKSVGFVIVDGDKNIGVVWNGKTNELGRDIIPVAVSNGAKYIYYVKNDSFYVQKGFNTDNREKLGEDVSYLYTNKDLSQVVFVSGSRAYISIKGGERKTLSGSIRNFIRPKGTASKYSPSESVRVGVYIYGISSFADTFYSNTDNSVVYINGKFETGSIAKNVSDVFLASDGKTLIYLRNGNICMVNGTNANAKAAEIVKGDVREFVATADGSAVFYVNTDDELYFQKGKGKSATVSNYITSSVGSALFKGNTLFYTDDGELFSSAGGRGKAVGVIDGNIIDVSAGLMAVYVTSKDGGDTFHYRSTDGNRFELIRQN